MLAMRALRSLTPLLCTLSVAATCLSLPAWANTEAIRSTALRHVQVQSRGLPGKVDIEIGQLAPNTRLPTCSHLEAFTPTSARPWGSTHVGVRCLGPNRWNILLPVQIRVTGNYVVTRHALSAGQTLQEDDLTLLQGELSNQPANVITETGKASGKILKNSLAANQPLRTDLLLAPFLVRQGQSVKLHARGENFSVSSEGKALNNAAEGQVAQIRAASGKTVSGIVQADGSVEIIR